jgi:nitroreductase
VDFSTPVTNTLKNRVTIRKFTDQPIPEQMLLEILRASRRSSTSSNMQTYSIVVVREQEKKKALAQLAGNQKHVETCAVFLAFCADLHRLQFAVGMHGTEMGKNLELTLVSTIDAAIVGMSVQTAAESMGLGTVMIGAMRNHPCDSAELLRLPKGVFVVYGMCLGYPEQASIPPQKPRLSEELVFHFEQYNTQDPSQGLQAYDQALAHHYQQLGRNLDPAAWTGPIAARLKTPPRPHLRAELEDLGFSFE